MRTKYQNLRSSTALARPAAGSGLPGQFWVNMADEVIGWFNDAGDAVELPIVKPPALSAYLPLAGGTMTGKLTLSGAPTATLHAVTKAYADAADAALSASINARLPLAGGTMTGALLLSAAPTALLGAATKGYVDGLIAGLQSGQVVAASATPIVLTGASPNVLVITGSEAQTVTLPSAANAGLGRVFTITNLSTATVTVQASNAATVGQPLEPGMTATLTCISSSGGGANSWSSSFTGATVRSGTGPVLHGVNPTITGATFDAPLVLNADNLQPLILRGRASDSLSQIDFRTNDGAQAEQWTLRAAPAGAPSFMQWRNNDVPRMTLFGAQDPSIAGRLQVFGPLFVAASTNDQPGIRIPQGAAPAAPVNGDIWTRSDGVFARINGQTLNLTPPFATAAEAIAGTATDRVMTPAAAAAREGSQSINMANISQAIFDQVPREAQQYWLSFGNVTLANGNVLVDFTSSPDQAHGSLRTALGAVYEPPTNIAGASAIELDNVGGSAGLFGTYQFERLARTGTVLIMTGMHRRGNTMFSHAARLIMNSPTLTFLRIRTSAGLFTTNPAVLRWRL
jgi:hypothetical protein